MSEVFIVFILDNERFDERRLGNDDALLVLRKKIFIYPRSLK